MSEILHEPTLDAIHRLKLTLPIIPVLLNYEGELELRSGANLSALLKQLFGN